MSGDDADHYRVLDIARSATADEVKTAYRRLVRVHRPEDDPDRFQRISEAYRVLSDPALRGEYDAEERLPAGVAAALDHAGSLIAKDPRAAVSAATQVLSQHGESTLVTFAVAAICLRAGRPLDALPVVRRLVAANPRRADYRAMLGDTLVGCKRLTEAEKEFRAALSLEPANVGAALSLSGVLDSAERPAEAIAAIDAGIRAGDVADLRRLPLHVRKICFLARDGRWPEMQRVVTAIQSSVPSGDADAARHVASELAGLGERYVEASAYDVAKFMVDAAWSVDRHPALKARSDELAAAAAISRACRDACEDPGVATWIKALLAPHFGQRVPDSAWTRNWHATVALVRAKRSRCTTEWKKFTEAHALAASAVAEHWKTIGEQSRASPVPAPSKASSSSWAGVLSILLVVLVPALISSRRKPPPAYTPPAYSYRGSEPGLSSDERLRRMIESMDSLDPETKKRLLDTTKPFDFDSLEKTRKRLRDADPAPKKTGK